MDCKHEFEVKVEYDDWGIFCAKCDDEVNQYVILTKETHDLNQAVVEAAIEERRLWEKYNAIKFTEEEDTRLTVAERDKVTKRYVVACQKTDEALTDLQGEQDENK